jgi:putative RecB family exonuclease
MWFVSRVRRIVESMKAMTAPPTTSPPAVEPQLLETLSPSRASDFKVCPQLFKFRAIDHIETPPTVYQARGTTAHLALQRLFDEPAPQRTPDRLFDLFRTAWVELRDAEFADLFEDAAEEREWGISSLEVLANYFNIEDPTTLEPLERELDMLQPVGDMTIRGILDRMEETDHGLIITDYKTGKAPPERYAIPAFFALKIYALLIRERTGRTPDMLRLMYLNGPTVYQIPITGSQLDAMQRQLGALWGTINRAIENDHFPPRPGRLCDWCSYKDICPAWTDPES